MIDTTQLIIYNIYITLDYATYMIMLSYDFLQETYTPISIGFFAFYTAILAFLYPQIIKTKTFLKQHSSEYLLNKFKEEKVIEYFLPITNASLLFNLFLIVFRCPFLLFVLSLVISLELLFLYYPSLRIMEKYTFEKEKVYKEEFEKLYSDDFKMLKQINDESKENDKELNEELKDEQFVKDIKQPSLRRYYLFLSSCQTDICNNLDDFETNSKLVDLIIENWYKWIEFARRNHLSSIDYHGYNCGNWNEKKIPHQEQTTKEQLSRKLNFVKVEPLKLLNYIVSVDKNNLLFSYIVYKLNFNFEKYNTFEIGNKKYEIINLYTNYFGFIYALFFSFIENDNSTNHNIEFALEKLPKCYEENYKYYLYKERFVNFDNLKPEYFLKQIALRIIRKRHEDVEIINQFFDVLIYMFFYNKNNENLLKEQTIVNYNIILNILSYYIVRNNYEIFGHIKTLYISYNMTEIVKLFFVIQRYRSDKFDNDSNNYEYEKYYILFWLLCRNKFNNDIDQSIYKRKNINIEKNYNDRKHIKEYAQQNYKDIYNSYHWKILNTNADTTYTDFLDYLIKEFFSNSLLINGLFRNKQDVLDDILTKQDDYKKYIKSVILTITDTINREKKRNEILTKIIIAYYLTINLYLLYLLLQKQFKQNSNSNNDDKT